MMRGTPPSMHFYPRSREGSDPVRSSTRTWRNNFYPRSPRGERLSLQFQVGVEGRISIHAPREGSDERMSRYVARKRAFLSTLPVRGATLPAGRGALEHRISIHAPREGSDPLMSAAAAASGCFYLRSP